VSAILTKIHTECPQCKEKFRTARRLREHLRHVHQVEEPVTVDDRIVR
jgi:hypothetical protein